MVKSKDRRPGGLYSLIGSGVPHICLATKIVVKAAPSVPAMAYVIEIWPGSKPKEAFVPWANLQPMKSHKFPSSQKRNMVKLVFGKRTLG